MSAPEPNRFRIGELARRVGVSASTLRSWERRYELLEPQRSDGNYRLYTAADEERIRRALQLVDQGMSMAEAAYAALAEPSGAVAADLDASDLTGSLIEALVRMDERGASEILDQIFAALSVERGLRDALLPALREIGDRWEDGSIGVAEEHFASNLLIARLHALASGWRPATGPTAVLACAPGEQHSIGLACLAVGLRGRGWAVRNLGADTPIEAVEQTAHEHSAKVVVLATVDPQRLAALSDGRPRLPAGAMLAIGGAGADLDSAERLGAELLDTDPLDAAARLTAELR